jgi:alpha-L-fucosidase
VRYVQKGKTLYAFSMGWGEKEVVFPELAPGGEWRTGRIQRVSLLGFPGALRWKQEARGLAIQMPEQKPCDHAVVFRVEGA